VCPRNSRSGGLRWFGCNDRDGADEGPARQHVVLASAKSTCNNCKREEVEVSRNSRVPRSAMALTTTGDGAASTRTLPDNLWRWRVKGRPQLRQRRRGGGVPGPACTEVCDGLDNDCDGAVDEDPVDNPWCWRVRRTVDNCVNGEEVQCVPGNAAPRLRWT
jgi:hypothetical protein